MSSQQMDCIQSIRKAIDYMEEHMLSDITYEDVARHVYMSNIIFIGCLV